MTSSEALYGGNDMRVLVLLPKSRDAESIPRVLEEIGVAATMCESREELCAELGRGAGAVMIEEQALSPLVGACLRGTLDSQPSWSELPIIVLLGHGQETKAARDALLLPGDVTLVERPVRVNTLVAIVRSALGSRRRQYLLRDQMQALARSESRYRTLFNSIDEGFCIIEVIFDDNEKPIDYRFLETNPSFEKQTGLVNAKGKSIRELVPKLEEYWYEIYGRIAATGEPHRFQNRAEELHAWYDVYAFRFGQPGERQVAVLFNDITERRGAEAEIDKLNADLVARAAELEEANRGLETFNYAIAHDLRNPLNLIGSYCQLIETLCGDQVSEECKGYLEKSYQKVLNMNQLISALLEFSQMAHIEPRLEKVDLSTMAQKTASDLRQAEPGRRTAFLITSGILANGDQNLLQVVLDNLLGNAWKYTGRQEEGVIEFGVVEIQGVATYFVRDNGPGFNMADADKLFTPFKRLSSAKDFQGHGIGLATVERIIHHHGGRIWAEGEPGKGATFYFTLGLGEMPDSEGRKGGIS